MDGFRECAPVWHHTTNLIQGYLAHENTPPPVGSL